MRLNELTSTGSDQIELFNAGSATVELAGWRVSDCGDNQYLLPPGSRIEPGAVIVLAKAVDHAFGLGNSDCVSLADDAGVEVDFTQWAARQAQVSWCRTPHGSGPFGPCDAPSFGASNPSSPSIP